jgi:hypothetical protein
MVKSRGGQHMAMRKRVPGAKEDSDAAIRASISFPRDVYETLESIAKEKKVSLAWVVREATEKYIGDRWPLFGKRKEP